MPAHNKEVILSPDCCEQTISYNQKKNPKKCNNSIINMRILQNLKTNNNIIIQKRNRLIKTIKMPKNATYSTVSSDIATHISVYLSNIIVNQKHHKAANCLKKPNKSQPQYKSFSVTTTLSVSFEITHSDIRET